MDGGNNTPSQKESSHSIGEFFSRMQVCRLHEAVMSRQVMLWVAVGKVDYDWFSVEE